MEINQEDIAPPYLSQHNAFPAGWNYLQPDDKPTHSMAFLMPPPYHSTKQLLLTSTKQYPNINNNDEQMANRNYLPSIVKYSKQMSSESDEFGFDMHSVVSMEILENQDQYKQTLKHFPQQRLTTFVEAKNNEVLRRVAEMQKMVESSQQYLNENDENGFPRNNGNSNYWRETSVDVESDTESLSSNKHSSDTNSPAPPPGTLKHSDSLTLLAETIKNDLNGINNGLNSIYTPFDCRSNGSSTTTNDTSTAPSSVSNTPKVQRRLNGLSQIISDLQALGNDSSDCDSESLYTPNSSPIHRNNNGNGIVNQSHANTNQLRVPSTQPKTFKQIRTSFGLHSPDALGDSKDNNLREYLRQLKEASSKDNNSDQDLAATKLAELYGFELGDDSFIETDPDLIDLTTIPPPQTPDELDIPSSVLSVPPSGFDDTDGNQRRQQKSNRDLEEFLKKVTIEPPTKIVTPAIELTPEEIMSFIIPPPPSSVSEQTAMSTSVKPKCAPVNIKPIPPVKPHNTITTTTTTNNNNNNMNINNSLKPVPLPKPTRENQNCNSFYDNHHGLMNCCEHLHSNQQAQQQQQHQLFLKQQQQMPMMMPMREQGPGTPENNVKSKVMMFMNGHGEYATVDRKGQLNYNQKPSSTMNGSYTNGSVSSSDDNDSLKLPPKRTINGHTCGRVPERPPKSVELQLKLNSPVRMIHNYGAYSLYNNTDNATIPPSLPPRINEKSPPPTDTLRKPPLPPIPAKPVFFPNSPMGSPSPKSPLPMFKNNSTNSSPIRTAGSPHFHHRHYSTMREGDRNMFNFNNASNGLNQLSPSNTLRHHSNGHSLTLSQNGYDKTPLSVLCSPQLNRKPCNHLQIPGSPQLSNKNGHVINVATLMAKTCMAMSGLLVKLDQVAVTCSDAQSAGGGSEIDEDKFQRSKDELTGVSLKLVTASKLLVIAMSDNAAQNLPEHLTACLTALRRIVELAQELVRYTSAPLQTRNIVLKIHDVASSFREMVSVPVGQAGAGQLALNANCLANVLATLLRSLRVFSP